MPIYEFKCNACDCDFEVLTYGDEDIVCEKCGSKNLTKKFSTFAVGSSSKSAIPSKESCPIGSTCPSQTCGVGHPPCASGLGGL